MLKSHLALITGASSGIGKETALLFAENGAHVMLLDTNKKDGISLEKEIREKNQRATFFGCDITDENGMTEVFQDIENQFGQITVTVASAGIDHISPLHETSLSEWQKVIDVNLTRMFLVNKLSIEQMLKNNRGSIVNISSIIGSVGQKNVSAYAASKGGVSNLTRSAAVTYASDGIRINAVCPGYIQTNLLSELTEEMVKERVDRHPMKRMGTANEIAEACLFLASDKASFITGVNLMVDGGYTAQ